MIRGSQGLQLCGGGGVHSVEYRHALGGAIDAIKYEAVQMDIQQQPL